MNGVPTRAVSSGLTSIHPDTLGLHYTLMGRDGKPIEGIWRPGEKQCMDAGNRTDRQSAMMKRLPSPFLLSDPACPPTSPSSPTAHYRNALAADGLDTCHPRSHSASSLLFLPGLTVPYVKVAPEDILKVQFPRFTTLDLRPTNTDISLAVAGLLTFFNGTTACLICAQADCLLNLEQLLRQFLISKETLSVRMLDESQDPTPLLKEIRDDKTATIIVDANATMSHIILERASELGMLSVYYTYIFTSLVRKWEMVWAFRYKVDFTATEAQHSTVVFL
ncbi:hypothetical protein PAMA_020612 [Pampus argenteus]